MKKSRTRVIAYAIVCSLSLVAFANSDAQSNSQIGVSKSDVAWIGVGVAAIGAGIGIGIYFAIHHNHTLTGCAVSGANGLRLQNKGDQVTYSLVGAVADIKSGDRVRVSGKRTRKSPGPTPQFLVDHVSKDYGACPATP